MRKPGKRTRKAPKRGLTIREQTVVTLMALEHAKRWAALFAINKWREIR